MHAFSCVKNFATHKSSMGIVNPFFIIIFLANLKCFNLSHFIAHERLKFKPKHNINDHGYLTDKFPIKCLLNNVLHLLTTELFVCT